MEIKVTRSTSELAFSLYPTGYYYEFLLQLSNRVAVRYELDTGKILLAHTGLGRGELEQKVDLLRSLLTPQAFSSADQDLAGLFSFLPNGTYSLEVANIENPVLVPLSKSRLDWDGVSHDAELDGIRERMRHPNLLISTQPLNGCDADTVELYRQSIRESGPEQSPLMVLLTEPHGDPGIHGKYHPDDQRYVSTQQSPPHFGFNGNHVFFRGANYFILDGHHKALAYEHLGLPPPALVIDCLKLDDESDPSHGSSRPPDLHSMKYRLTVVTLSELGRFRNEEDASPPRIANVTISRSLLQNEIVKEHLALQELSAAYGLDIAWRVRAIFERPSDECIGFVSLAGFPDRDGTVELSLVVPDQRAELLEEVISQILTWVFSFPQAKRVVTTLSENHHASLRAAARAGMVSKHGSAPKCVTLWIDRAWWHS